MHLQGLTTALLASFNKPRSPLLLCPFLAARCSATPHGHLAVVRALGALSSAHQRLCSLCCLCKLAFFESDQMAAAELSREQSYCYRLKSEGYPSGLHANLLADVTADITPPVLHNIIPPNQ